MQKLFLFLYDYFQNRRGAFLATLVVSFCIVGFFASQIVLEEDISKVLPNDKKIEKLNQVFQNAKFSDKLVITVSQKDSTSPANADSLIAFATLLSEQIDQQIKPQLKATNYKVDEGLFLEMFDQIRAHLPIYLSEEDYKTIDSLIDPQRLKTTLENDVKTLSSPAGIALKNMISADPIGITTLGIRKLQQLQHDDNFELYDGFVMSKDHRNVLMFVIPKYSPNNTGKNTQLFDELNSLITKLSEGRSVSAQFFGTAVIAAGNAQQLRKDTILTQGITVLFLIFFIGLYFRRKSAAFLILVPVLFGSLFSLSVLYFFKGHISIIALGTGSVVLGIAVNYSLHVFNHHRHRQNMRLVIQDLAEPLTIGGFTTIGGFLCLQFVKSEILKDLGLFAAFSLVGAALSSLIFLPHLIVGKKTQVIKHSWIDNVAEYRLENSKTVVAIILILTLVFGYTARWVGFEADMTSMNYMSNDLKRAEANLNRLNQFSLQSVYLVSSGQTLNQALRNNEKAMVLIKQFKAQNIVKKYAGVGELIASDSMQKAKIAHWNNYWTAEKKQTLFNNLSKAGVALKFSLTAFDNFKTLLNTDFNSTVNHTIPNNFLGDYISKKNSQTIIITLLKIDRKDKQKVYDAFENDSNITVVDKQYLTSRLVEIINFDFNRIALFSSLLVFCVLFLSYGRIELALMSFVPMLITWVWILGIMGIFGLKFNIINVIVSALIFGLGDDYSIFIMDGLLQEYRTGKKNLSSYKSSILLSGITTIAGLGVLVFAQHPALKSIALISIIGIVCVVFIAQLLIPFLFQYFIKSRTDKGLFPWTWSNWLKAFYGYFIFISGSWSLAIIGVFLIKLNPVKSEKINLFYHKIISKFAQFMMRALVNVKKTIHNPYKEDFSKPVVIIANHHSVLDILMMLWLHPKIIMLTNNWVKQSPLFGWVVQTADFYQVSDGAEGSVELLRHKVAQGYSVMVFPEGTRSLNTSINRFHKGAFFIAEQLKLDMLPVIIHGSSYTLRKGDFMLKDGNITVQFLPKIKQEDGSWGQGFGERTKSISRYFKEEYKKLSITLEKPAYFKEQLMYNYLYKGPVLEWYLRIKLRLEKNYALFDDLVLKQGKVLDIGCGYGFMSYMLHFTSPERTILGIDYDQEKIDVAQHCLNKTSQINFHCTDVTDFEFGEYDAIILSDVLHYLQPDKQKIVIQKCIDALNKGGKVIIREGNMDLEERHRGTKLSEFFSTKLIRFNKVSQDGLSFLSTEIIKKIAIDNGLSYTEIDNTKYTSNLILVLGK